MSTVILTPAEKMKVQGVAKCSACQTLKPVNEFYLDRSRHNNCSSRCRSCERERARIRYREIFLKKELEALLEANPQYKPVMLKMAAQFAA